MQLQLSTWLLSLITNSTYVAIEQAGFQIHSWIFFRHLLAVGLESGELLVYSYYEEGGHVKCDVLIALDKMHWHTAAVKRLKWRPRADKISLASCSLDHCVKLFHLTI